MQNNFLFTYRDKLNKLRWELDNFKLAGSSDTKLDLEEVQVLFKGCINEIKSLQEKVDVLTEALKNTNKKE